MDVWTAKGQWDIESHTYVFSEIYEINGRYFCAKICEGRPGWLQRTFWTKANPEYPYYHCRRFFKIYSFSTVLPKAEETQITGKTVITWCKVYLDTGLRTVPTTTTNKTEGGNL